jgi:hypothetical protein
MSAGNGDNTITLHDAQRWALTWRKVQGTYNSHNELMAFHIPLEDIKLIQSEGADAVRAYLGVNDEGEEKLMIVGTKYDSDTGLYNDMIPGVDAKGDPTTGNIYDFTRPCPQSCGHNSLLKDIPINN